MMMSPFKLLLIAGLLAGGTVLAQSDDLAERYDSLLERMPFTPPSFYQRQQQPERTPPPPPPRPNTLTQEVRMVSYSEFPEGRHNFTLVDLNSEDGRPVTSTVTVGQSTGRLLVEQYLPPDSSGLPGVRVRAGGQVAAIRLAEGNSAAGPSGLAAINARSSSTPSHNNNANQNANLRRAIAARRGTSGSQNAQSNTVQSGGTSQSNGSGASGSGSQVSVVSSTQRIGTGRTPNNPQSSSVNSGSNAGEETSEIRRRIVPRRRFIRSDDNN
ncbi:MAG: hypothetical protein ACFB21_12480 [Opitutales bacterium]